MNRFLGCAAVWAMIFCSVTVAAHAADLRVEGAWVRLPPPATDTAAAYMTIRNDGNTDVVITGADSDIATSTGLHHTVREGTMMRMKRVKGLVIPAHGKLSLVPAGTHVMLEGVRRRLKAGEVVHLVLRTASGDILNIDAHVRTSRGAIEPGRPLFVRAMRLLKARDAARAAKLLKRAAALGNRRAQYQLGLLYARGDGVERNLPEARALLRRAALQGHPKAQFYLGQMYAFGDGGEKNKVLATMWFWLATTLGDRYARDSLRVMTGKISAAELAEAKKRAKALWRRMPHDMKIKRGMAMH